MPAVIYTRHSFCSQRFNPVIGSRSSGSIPRAHRTRPRTDGAHVVELLEQVVNRAPGNGHHFSGQSFVLLVIGDVQPRCMRPPRTRSILISVSSIAIWTTIAAIAVLIISFTTASPTTIAPIGASDAGSKECGSADPDDSGDDVRRAVRRDVRALRHLVWPSALALSTGTLSAGGLARLLLLPRMSRTVTAGRGWSEMVQVIRRNTRSSAARASCVGSRGLTTRELRVVL